jgi:hypothetical protein
VGRRPVLFVAREPDETLRTFLPIIAELQRRDQPCLVLFYHEPGRWALERLAELRVPLRKVQLPDRLAPGWMAALRPPVGELRQLWRTRRLARALVAQVSPAAVVVIQDTLLLERFLVREANRAGRGTLVVQWAFTFPQAMYDRLREVRRTSDVGRRTLTTPHDQRWLQADRAIPGVPSRPHLVRRPTSHVRRRLYALAQRLLDVKFDLANSYGGGEARVFAVMGRAFRQQFLAQGVRKERIEVTGHPLHDLAFARRAPLSSQDSSEVRARYHLPPEARIVLYATQPVLWRAVVTRDQLTKNVLELGRAVSALGHQFELLLKLHPREAPEDYAQALDTDLPIRLVQYAEITDLIGLCEVFISASSSTVLMAMMLDKPIVTVNFNQVPHFDYYETLGGTLHVKDPAQAQEALCLALFDGPTRARLATERADVLARCARFDGRATQRLADLVVEVAAS